MEGGRERGREGRRKGESEGKRWSGRKDTSKGGEPIVTYMYVHLCHYWLFSFICLFPATHI